MVQIQLEARRTLLRRGILTLIERDEPLELILNRLIENLEAQSDQMMAAIFFYDPASRDLCVGAAPNLQPGYKKAVNGFKIGPEQPACGSAVFRRERVVCADVRVDPLWERMRPHAIAARISAVWSQPLFDEKHDVLGTLAFYFAEPKHPDLADLTVLEVAGELAALAIQCRRTQFREATRRQRGLI